MMGHLGGANAEAGGATHQADASLNEVCQGDSPRFDATPDRQGKGVCYLGGSVL